MTLKNSSDGQREQDYLIKMTTCQHNDLNWSVNRIFLYDQVILIKEIFKAKRGNIQASSLNEAQVKCTDPNQLGK